MLCKNLFYTIKKKFYLRGLGKIKFPTLYLKRMECYHLSIVDNSFAIREDAYRILGKVIFGAPEC